MKLTTAVIVLLLGTSCYCWSSDFATRVISYTQGANPVRIIPTTALGAPSIVATPTVPEITDVVSIGIGGQLTLGFDRQIPNGTGYDLIVFGNAMYQGSSVNYVFQEPGTIEVGVDVNGNGYDASDPFYKIKGSLNPAYSYGAVDRTKNPTWGYADCTPTDGTGNPRIPSDPFTNGITPGSAGGDAINLDWAVDSNGQPVVLDHVDFVRITPALNVAGYSPEVDAVSIVHDANVNYYGQISISAIQKPYVAGVRNMQAILRDPVSHTALQTVPMTIDDQGSFSFSTPISAPVEMLLQAPGCLAAKVILDPNASTSVNISLIRGDTNGDNQINLFDFVELDKHFGSSDPLCDINMDGYVNLFDYVQIDTSFGAQGSN
ncbi:MAG: hypothetical protein ACYC1M_18715 [Armatimonadota bacterium]